MQGDGSASGERRVFRSQTMRAAIGTILGNLPGFLLGLAILPAFGVGRDTDAYFFAYGLALFPFSILYMVVEPTVLPVARNAAVAGRESFSLFVRTMYRRVLLAANGAMLVTLALAVIVIRFESHWTAAEKTLSLSSLAVLGVFVVVGAANGVLDSCLYALDSFLLPLASQGIRTCLPLIVCFLGPHGATGVLVMSGTLVVGEIVRGIWLWIRISPHVASLPPGELKTFGIWSTAWPQAIAMLIVSLNPIVGRTIAGQFRPGSLTLVDVAERLLQAPLQLITFSVVLVAGARWVELIRRNSSELRKDVIRGVRAVSIVSTGTAGILVLGFGLTGNILADHLHIPLTLSWKAVLAATLLGLPGAAIINVGTRFLTAAQRTSVLPFFASASLAAVLVGDLVGAHIIGVAGIAWATMGVRLATAIGFLIAIMRVIGQLERARTGDTLLASNATQEVA